MAAPAYRSETRTINDLVTTTLDRYVTSNRGKLSGPWKTSNIVNYLNQHGAKRIETGGNLNRFRIYIGKGGTVKRIQGGQKLDITTPKAMTDGYYPFRQSAGNFFLPRDIITKNSGDMAAVSLAARMQEQVMADMAEDHAIKLIAGEAADPAQPENILHEGLLQIDLDSGTSGQINPTTHATHWAAQRVTSSTFGTVSTGDGKSKLRELMTKHLKANNKLPDVGFCDYDGLVKYATIYEGQEQLTAAVTNAAPKTLHGGFAHYLYQGVPLIGESFINSDQGVAGYAFFLDLAELFLLVQSASDMAVVSADMLPASLLGKTWVVVHDWSLVCTSRQHQGLLTGMTSGT